LIGNENATTIHSNFLNTSTPYSLGKLIDWKQPPSIIVRNHPIIRPPYSLGKLIDWKPLGNLGFPSTISPSLLAREIN
jgi:hypothetical protein